MTNAPNELASTGTEMGAGPLSGSAEKPPLVLIASDQEWSTRSLETILAPEGYAVLRAYTGSQALERARTAHPDLVIIEAQLPDIPGIEVCRSLRDDPRFLATIPLIVTTAGPSGRAQRLEAYRNGAWEFLGQPIDGESLLLKLDTYLQAKKAVDSLRDQSLLDLDSGLYNMRGLAHRAREIGSEAYRHHHPLACVVFSSAAEAPEADDEGWDDRVRAVAEAFGTVVKTQGRISDAIGRLGPREFAVIAPATTTEGVLRLVDRLREAVESAEGSSARLPVRLLAGYSAVPDFAEASLDPVELLLRATTALRQLLGETQRGETNQRVRGFEAGVH